MVRSGGARAHFSSQHGSFWRLERLIFVPLAPSVRRLRNIGRSYDFSTSELVRDHTEIDRKSSQCAPALRRTSRTTNLDPKSAIVAPKMPDLPPKMAFVAPKMALWALLVASRTCPEASPERPWAPRGHQNRFLTAILVAWDALGLVFGVRFGRFWRPAMLLTGRFVTPTLQPCTRPYTSAAPK